jgi:hypothetical protein
MGIENKNFSLFESQLNFIWHGSYNSVMNICTDISWERRSVFQKHIIKYPESYIQ